MSKVYEVRYKHLVELDITELVRADSEEEAISKSRDGDVLTSDEDDCPQQGLEIKDYEASEADEETQAAWPEEEE